LLRHCRRFVRKPNLLGYQIKMEEWVMLERL
jgi:hypothetical protein